VSWTRVGRSDAFAGLGDFRKPGFDITGAERSEAGAEGIVWDVNKARRHIDAGVGCVTRNTRCACFWQEASVAIDERGFVGWGCQRCTCRANGDDSGEKRLG
jgi:hypothetical protein